MNRVSEFKKVSYKQFKDSLEYSLWFRSTHGNLKPESQESEDYIREIYNNIQLPTRATKGSAGYDFKAPFEFTLKVGETIKIPTGIRVWMKEGWFLGCVPRSGLGFKYRLQLDNTFGIVDEDFFYSDNEGMIYAKITNDGKEGKIVEVKQGQGFIQGIFIPYGITVDDEVSEERNGGFGSTDK